MKDLNLMGKTWMVLLCSMGVQCISDSYSNDELHPCEQTIDVNWNMRDLVGFASEQPSQITEEVYVEGWVISSDQAGNFFNELWLQDDLSNSQSGIKIVLEQRDTHVRYPVGMRLFISLKGLWIRKKYGLCEVGSALSLFGNQSIGRIPFHQLTAHIKVVCGDQSEVVPSIVSLNQIGETHLNTLIRIANVEFEYGEIGQTLALVKEETERIITDCLGNDLRVLTSGYSDFYQDYVPDTHGQITGILMADRQGFYLKVREAKDILLKNERCLIPIEPKTSDQILITEIADPDNAAEGRFLELYNEGESSFNLEGWRLVRYTNANLEVGSVLDLTGLEIQGKSALVIAAKGPEFESIYGFAPDAIAGTNSPADSNGDDNLALLDPFDEVIDLFGVIGEDGSGTDHEFEDGKAVRNSDIHSPNAMFFSNEWTIFNDSGPPGTIHNPQEAPADFNPGVRN